MADSFESLCDRALHAVFERQDDSEINPRQAALQAIVEQYPHHSETLALLRDRATEDPDEQLRSFAIEQVVAIGKEKDETLPWLKTRAQSDASSRVIQTAAHILAVVWKEDLATLNWFKTYAQFSKNPAVRRAAIQELGRGWKDEFNVFEILCKCAGADPFKRQHEWEINPRLTALAVMVEQYPNSPQLAGLLRDRAEHDSDEQVRQFAIAQLDAIARL